MDHWPPLMNRMIEVEPVYDPGIDCRDLLKGDGALADFIGAANAQPSAAGPPEGAVPEAKPGPRVSGHSIYVVDLQDGGNWDWTAGEPPKTNAAYYLRFCKSFSRMGGAMHYVQCDNATFMHRLYRELAAGA